MMQSPTRQQQKEGKDLFLLSDDCFVVVILMYTCTIIVLKYCGLAWWVLCERSVNMLTGQEHQPFIFPFGTCWPFLCVVISHEVCHCFCTCS